MLMLGSARNYFPLCALSCSYKDDFQAISVNFEIEFFFLQYLMAKRLCFSSSKEKGKLRVSFHTTNRIPY